MNIKSIIFIIYIIFNINTIIVKSQLPTNQNDTAVALNQKIRGTSSIINPCDSGYMKCITSGNGAQSISEIKYTSQVNPTVILDTDFSVFIDLETLELPIGVYSTKILDNLTYMPKLKTLYLGSQVNTYNDDLLALPSSLESITIQNSNIKFGKNIFKSKTLKQFVVASASSGYQIPSSFPLDFPAMDALDFFQTPVLSGSNFPDNIGTVMPALASLSLIVYNQKDISVQYFDFPTLSKIPSLTYLGINFVSGIIDDYHTWPYPTSIANISPILSSLYISGFGFEYSSQLDFSSLKEGFKLTIYSTDCNYATGCASGSCIRLPKNADLSIDCTFDVNKIDFSNVTLISISGNMLEQDLPTTLKYDQLQNVRFESNAFTGPLPEAFCNLPINRLVLKNNKFNGNVLSCFSCHGAKGLENLFPNEWADFGPNSLPSNCPSRLLNDTNVIAQTESSTVITLQGKDFGWSVGNNSKFNILIPNKLMTVSIDRGVGSGNQAFALIDNVYTYALTYSYEKPTITGYEYDVDKKVFSLIGTGFNFIEKLNNVTFNGNPQLMFWTDVAVKTNDGKDKITQEGSQVSYIFGNLNLKVGDKFSVTITVGNQVSDAVTFSLSDKGTVDPSESSNDDSNDSSVNSTSKIMVSKLFALFFILVLLN